MTILREIPVQVGARTSWAGRKLPAAPTVASNSAAILANFKNDYVAANADGYFEPSTQLPGTAKQFSHSLVVVDNSMPLIEIVDMYQPQDAGYPGVKSPMKSPAWMVKDDLTKPNPTAGGIARFRVPLDLAIPDGSDHGVALWNADTGEYLEGWLVTFTGGRLGMAWGGYKQSTTGWDFRWNFPQGDPRYHSGCAAVGIALIAYVTRLAEWLSGEINHPVGIATINALSQVCFPGTRTDGLSTGDYMAEGQIAFLPRSVNIDAMHLHPAIKTLAKAAQEYGFISTDKAGSLGMNAVNPAQFEEYRIGGANPYWQLGISENYNEWFYRLFNGTATDPSGAKWDPFPIDQLKFTALGYVVPADDPLTVSAAVEGVARDVIPSVKTRLNGESDVLRGMVRKAQTDVEQNTKTLIPDGPITITETAEGIKIGSTATVSTTYPATF